MAPYSFLTARELSNFTPKSRAESCSKMPTNMASKFLQFVYRKCCVDRLPFQNIYRLNRRPYLFLLDLKEKCTRYAGVPTNKADLFDPHDHWAGHLKQGSILPHLFAVLGVVTFVEQTQTPRYASGYDSSTSIVVWRARGARCFENRN